ncbi:MAG: methionine ABC transporter permease [Clostridiales bacterium]|nr:methionine ABC transporter permease [Clostridiales bacterium]
MSIVSTIVAYILGLLLGIVLSVTRKNGIRPMRTLNAVLGVIINFMRSIPFLILLAMLFPITKDVVGKKSGTVAVVFPLIMSAFPYVARMVEGSLNEVDGGVLEAAQAMGSTTFQIIRKVLLPEALPSLINGFSICMTTILAYTAMASAAAGGGLGSVAITYGLNQNRYDIMYAASIMLVVLVQIITITGTVLNRKKDHRLR